MTVNTLKTRVSYTGDASNTDFAFDMLINEDSDLEVYLDGVKQTTGYEVLGGTIQAGIVQFAAAPNSGVVVLIIRVSDYKQLLDLISGGLNPDTVEYALDKIVHKLQNLNDRLNRSPQFGIISPTTGLELPEPVGDTAIGYNTAGNALVNLAANAACSAAFLKNCSIPFENTAYFDSEVDNGDSGATDTIDWTKGNKQKSTLTNNCTFTFTAPGGQCNLILRLIQDATGSRTVTWPAAVKWPSGTPPVLTTTANAVDIVAFFYNGTNYYGVANLNFG